VNYVPSGTGIYLAGNEAPPGNLKQGSSLPGEESTFHLSEVLGSLHKEGRSGDGPPALRLAVADWLELGH